MAKDSSTRVLFIRMPTLVVEAFQRQKVNGFVLKGNLNGVHEFDGSEDVQTVDAVLLHLNDPSALSDLTQLHNGEPLNGKLIGVFCAGDVDFALTKDLIASDQVDGLVRITLNDSTDKLAHHIRLVLSEQRHFEQELMRRALIEDDPRTIFNQLLSDQERRVCILAVLGESNKEIANRLNVSKETVKKHLSSSYEKLGIDGRGRLARFCPQRDAMKLFETYWSSKKH